MVNDHVEARLWADHGAEFSQSIANGLAQLFRAKKRCAARENRVPCAKHPVPQNSRKE
jgi:hypothetical protein